jgi:hypothetical protein
MANGELSPIATAEATSGDVSSICVSITVIASRRSGVISCVNGRAFGSPCSGSLSIGVGHSTSSVVTASYSASCTFFLFFAVWAFGSPGSGSLSIVVGHSTSLSSVATASCSASCTFFCFSPSGFDLLLIAFSPF